MRILGEALFEGTEGAPSLETLKISGGIKQMTAAALREALPDGAPIDDYIDGAMKEIPEPALGRVPLDRLVKGMVSAALDWAGVVEQAVRPDEPVPAGHPFAGHTPRAMGEALVTALEEGLRKVTGETDLVAPKDRGACWPDLGRASSRLLQQVLGREWKQRFSQRLWSQSTAEMALACTADIAIVDDMRYPADYEDMAAIGAILVRLNRPDAEDVNSHPSEGLLEDRAFHLRLENDGSLEDFEETVRREQASLLHGLRREPAPDCA
ncbi:hypothetical protein LAZ40_11035 [Cereibacter sphaeroides]|uniref:deoxynucleotide monophosphate kinase family protein n=1 Tax=Cereibacter sphaeroides TaxID=1063 RepID=UPI001F176AFB|nr:hypothetical protein [Cereibacter sphaeroides]MCE6959590.1 hypothetical protein [Cereibacter sphaeroides]MCE6974550.1 hypothetical protein [Cereibacter sphaeroides]